MTDHPKLWTRIVARLHGEVAAEALEAYQRAGAEVYRLLEDLEGDRDEWKVKGVDAWSVDGPTQAAFLCAWSAFSLQLLGDRLLDADYEGDPSTVGFVPPVTAAQALAFYGQVPGWLRRARQARGSGTYELDVAVPVALPPWSEVEPCPVAHLAAMRSALDQLRRHTDAAMAGFHLNLDDDERRRAHDRVHEILADAEASAAYADQLWTPQASRPIHEAVELHAKHSVEQFYLVGQLLAMPRLALLPPPAPRRPDGNARRRRSGSQEFDKWCLTDPESRDRWKADREARRAIEALWANDPDPDATLGIQHEIDAAIAAGDVAYASDGRGARVGHYYCCPWSPIYQVRRPVLIGGRTLTPLMEFTFDVSAEEMAEGGAFRREILVAQFHPTQQVDYCIPGEHGD